MTDKLKELALECKPLVALHRPDGVQSITLALTKFHRAASPDAILALIKRAEDAEAEVELLKGALEMTRTALIEHGTPFRHHELRYQEAIHFSNKALASGAAPKETDRG